MRKKRLIGLFTLLMTISSCNFSPPWHRPCVEMPANWRWHGGEFCAIANIRWWQQFGDPFLDCYIAIALQNNKTIKIAIENVNAAYAQLGIVRSELYPSLNFSASGFREESSAIVPVFPGGSRYFDLFNIAFNASYELDVWGRIRNASDAALAQLLGQIDARRTVGLTLVSSVASAYVQLRLYDMQLKISLDTLKSRKYSYELADIRFKEGLTSQLEVWQAKSEMEGAAVQVRQFQLLIAQQEDFLSVLLGQPPHDIERGLDLEQLIRPCIVPANLPSSLLNQRPDILQAEKQVIAANAGIGEARANFFPQITLTGNYGGESTQLSNILSGAARTWMYGATIVQPIFQGFLLTNQLRLAETQKRLTIFNYQQTVLQALQEVNDAIIAHIRTKQLVQINKQRVHSLSESLKLATLQYNEGETDYLNVLDAERNLFSAQLDLAQTEADYLLTYISLYKALGGGWVIDADNFVMSKLLPCCK